jgi:hypothetical protein
MPPSPSHIARVRAEILQNAARLFRLRGYAGTSIDDVMLAAGLTRGAFLCPLPIQGRAVRRGDPRRAGTAVEAAR